MEPVYLETFWGLYSEIFYSIGPRAGLFTILFTALIKATVFDTVSNFYPSLLFSGKAWSGWAEEAPLEWVPVNIRPGWN